MKINQVHSVAEQGFLPDGRLARVQHPRSESKTTEVEACMTTYLWFVLLQIINGRLNSQTVQI